MLHRGEVTVLLDDGTVFTTQGQVLIQERKTTADVEFADGTRKGYPLHSVDIRVIIKDVAHEVMERRVAP